MHQVPEPYETPREYCLRQEHDELISWAISMLDERERHVTIGLYYLNKTQKEIALEHGLAKSTMSEFLQNVLAKLRMLLRRRI